MANGNIASDQANGNILSKHAKTPGVMPKPWLGVWPVLEMRMP